MVVADGGVFDIELDFIISPRYNIDPPADHIGSVVLDDARSNPEVESVGTDFASADAAAIGSSGIAPNRAVGDGDPPPIADVQTPTPASGVADEGGGVLDCHLRTRADKDPASLQSVVLADGRVDDRGFGSAVRG